MDEFYEQEHQAWLDERNAVISFHEIPQSEYFRAPDGVFWVYICRCSSADTGCSSFSCNSRPLRYNDNKIKTAGGNNYDRTCM